MTLRRLTTGLPTFAFVVCAFLEPTMVWAGQASGSGAATKAPRIAFEHDGKDVSGFVVYLSPQAGTPIRLDLGRRAPDATGHIVVVLPDVPLDTYRVEIAAYNSAGESPRTVATPASLTFGSAAAPGHDHGASAAAHTPTPPDSKPSTDATKKKSGLGRLWQVLVGDDSNP